MSPIVLRHGAAERTLVAADFPLSLGGNGCALPLPGVEAAAPVAYLGLADGHLFVQSAGSGLAVGLNDVPVLDSRWLQHGDVLSVGPARLACRVEEATTFLTVAAPGGPAIGPPAEPPPAPPVLVSAVPAVDAAGSGDAGPRAGRRTSGRLALVGLAFLALALAAGFVFLATPVALDVSPAPEQLAMDGAVPTIVVGGRRLALPGRYRVRAELTGHHPLDAEVRVTRGTEQRFAFEMRRLPGRLALTTRPLSGVSVVADGEAAGATPLAPLTLEAGAHRLELAAPRHRTEVLHVEVEGMGRTQSLEVALLPLWAPVTFDSTPQGATVALDGEPLVTTPGVVDLLEGAYTLAVTLPAYDPVEVPIEVRANEPLRVPDIVLRESDGVLALTTRPAGASVSVGGTFAGRTPVELALRPREEHELSLSLAGHAGARRTVALLPAVRETLDVTLKALIGTVFVTAVPADAELYVDGKLVGNANRRLRLTAVEHALEVRRSGHESFRTTVRPRPGASLRVRADLTQTGKAATAGAPAAAATAAGQKLRLVRPKGEFTMGASRREQGRRGNEDLRLVKLERPFYLAETEVTNAEYRAFRAAHRSGVAGRHSLDGDRQPVVNVTWEQAVEYLNWLSAKDGLPAAYERDGDGWAATAPLTTGYRLPTEAEWAYVARFTAPKPRKYPWGDGFPPSKGAGNYADLAAAGFLPNVLPTYADGHAVSAPVGTFPPGPLGVLDLGGNVAEWCHDFYGVHPDAAGRLVVDPLGPASGRHHVVRGSGWRHYSISELRLSYRDYSEKARQDLGFRVARYAE